jgi:hypothetical protein
MDAEADMAKRLWIRWGHAMELGVWCRRENAVAKDGMDVSIELQR